MENYKKEQKDIEFLVKENTRLLNQLKRNKRPICPRPWTGFEERSIEGGIKPCCWFNNFIGKMKNEEDFFSIWNGEAIKEARKLMLKGRIESICSPMCPVLFDVFHYNKELFYEYPEDELKSFDYKFLANRKLVIESILEGRIKMEAYPLRLKLHPSNRCNLRCVMCFLDEKEKRVEKQWYFSNFFRSLKVYLEELKVFGGEPFFCEISKSIIFEPHPYKQLFYSFVSNGVLIAREIIDKLAKMRIGWIDISLDSCVKETYESIRKGSNFSTVYKNLQNLINLRETHKINKFDIYGDFVIQTLNYTEIASFISFCNSLKIIPNFTFVVGQPLPPLKEAHATKDSIENGLKRADELHNNEALKNLERLKVLLNRFIEMGMFGKGRS